jgi:methionine-rich copper-binding protein CopC
VITRVLMRSAATTVALVTFAASLSMAVLVWAPTPASAHSELVETTPAAGSIVKEAPTDVELVFGEGVQEQGGSIVVSLQDTVVSRQNTFAVQNNVATVQLQDADQPGTYRVEFRIVSADGHTLRDTFAYALKDATPTATSSGDPAEAPATTPDTSPLAGEPSDEDGSGAVVWVLGAGAIGLALVAALIAVAVRGRRDRSS